MSTEVTWVAQYIPFGGYTWVDLDSTPAGVESAAELIIRNEVSWDAAEHNQPGIDGRPLRYRIIRREITETVVREEPPR